MTVAAGELKRKKIIRYSRGEMVILNRKGLEAAACSCYAALMEQLAYVARTDGGRLRRGRLEMEEPSLPQLHTERISVRGRDSVRCSITRRRRAMSHGKAAGRNAPTRRGWTLEKEAFVVHRKLA